MLTRREIPILIVNLIYIPIFTFMALRNTNYEFILYVLVILVVGGVDFVETAGCQVRSDHSLGLNDLGLDTHGRR